MRFVKPGAGSAHTEDGGADPHAGRPETDGDIVVARHAHRKPVEIALLGELGKLGSNVNQIARALNQGRTNSLDTEAMQTLEATRSLIEALGEEIREALL